MVATLSSPRSSSSSPSSSPRPASLPAAAPPLDWTSSLRDLPREHGFEPLRVEGHLPAELTGTLYRTGPALFSSFGDRYQHWFDGDGALSAVRFAGGRAQGPGKHVQTRGLTAERRAGKRLFGGYGTRAAGFRRVLPVPDKFKNAANTSVMVWNQRLYALWEGGRPTEMSPADLGTVGEQDLGVIGQAFSAHPHRVPSRRATYNFGVRYGRRTVIDLFELPDAGPARKLGEVVLARPTMIHDFVATERHLVFFVPPVDVQPVRMLLGLTSLGDAGWRPELGTEVVVVPIDAPTRVTRFHIDAFYQWHFVNAYERGGEIVVDVVRYPDFDSNRWLGDLALHQVGDVAGGELWRVTLDPGARRASAEPRFAETCEFPRVAPAVEATRHQVAYVGACTPASTGASTTSRFTRLPDAIVRVDVETGAARRWSSGGGVVSEPVFVPRPGARAEDDGWLLALVYDPRSDASNITVLPANDPSSGPTARAWFDHLIPPTFHGAFAP
jgi:all-trans-8'-apo-beta-carotenal 15,15'-oxygenase